MTQRDAQQRAQRLQEADVWAGTAAGTRVERLPLGIMLVEKCLLVNCRVENQAQALGGEFIKATDRLKGSCPYAVQAPKPSTQT